MVNYSVHNTGSTGFVQVAAFADVIQKSTGVLLRLQPSVKTMERIQVMRQGDTQFITATSVEAHDYQLGTGEMAIDGWGPQTLRLAWNMGPTPAPTGCAPIQT